MGRLFDVQNLDAGGAGEPPGFSAVFAAEDALLAASEQHAGPARIDAERRGVLAAQAGTGILPGGATVMAHLNAGGVAEIDRAGIVAVHGHVEQFGDVATRQNLPTLAAAGNAQQAVAGGGVDHGRVARIEIERGDEGMIEAGVPPLATDGFEENAAGRELGAHDVVLGTRPAGVESVLGENGKRQQCRHEPAARHRGLL